MDFSGFVKGIVDNEWNVYGVEVYKDGELAHSYGDTAGIYEIYSATKTITSIAAGIAYDEGRIDLDKTILEYLPREKTANMPQKQRAAFEMITLRRLLTMSVGGWPFRADGESWIDFSLGLEISEPEKKVFNYSNICAYLAGVCVTEAIGSDLGAFIEDRIFKPLGIEKYAYTRCPEGYFYGASGMKLTVNN